MEDQKPFGMLIKSINTLYEKDYSKRLKSIGITASQGFVLSYLFHTNKETVTQRDIEKHLNLKNPTVTGLLNRLDENGFILCVPSVTDKRCKNIYLTEKAYGIQKRMESDRKKMDKALLRGMTKKEQECFRKYLDKVLYNLSD